MRGLPRARRNLWIVLALNAALLFMALVVLFAESDKSMGLEMLGIAIVSIACSYGGLVLAARAIRSHETD